MKLGGFTDDEAKSKSIQMHIHRRDLRPSISTHKKGVSLEVDAKSLELNMSSVLGGSNKSLPSIKKQKNKHKKKKVTQDTAVAK